MSAKERRAMTVSAPQLTMTALPGLPIVQPGDDLLDAIDAGMQGAGLAFADGDVLVLAQKIVSKSEGRFVDLRDVTPSERAIELATATGKDPRQVELVLSEAKEVLRYKMGVLIVVHRLGLVIANAGIDASNVQQEDGSERVLLLPLDPDRSAAALRKRIAGRHGADVAVIINDSVGRAWRNGTMGLALGCSGLPALHDIRGEHDMFGRELMVSVVGLADELSSAASVMQGQGAEGTPVVHMRGLRFPEGDLPAASQLRPLEEDMFR